ncbi:MAG: M1 family aminopeptidase [Steroidobacteraceae bacterium]
MRNFLDVLRFELRQQCSSPMFVALMLLFFVIHLLTISQVGINISDNELIAYNSAYMIFRTELVLGVFGMLPALIFVVNAAVRDHAQATAELVYTTPVARLPFLLGRFAGGTLCTLAVGLADVLGTATGTFMPWLEAGRVAAFSWQPYTISFAALVVPNLLVFCALSFCVAALTRTAALSFATALVFVVLGLVINAQATSDAPAWLSMLDPFGALAVEQAIHFWAAVELNTLLPVAYLPANRLLWLGLAALVFALTCWRFRLEVTPGGATRWLKFRLAAPEPAAAIGAQKWRTYFSARGTLAQLVSQLHMDLRAVLLSPLFWVVVLLTVISTVSEVKGTVDPTLSKLPLHPVTSHLLSIFRAALFQFALIVIVFYSAVLMHREREHRLHEILGALPYHNWVMLISKVLALCSVLLLLLLASMLVCVGMQTMAGYYDFELGVYLQGLFVNTGFYFCMFAVLACVLQTLVPGKWSGMLVVFGVLLFLIVLPVLGWEHLLYGFRIPNVVYTDMNGFGHFLLPTYSLIVYWGAFCVLLAVAGHLLLPRGADASAWARLRNAGTRLTPAIKATAAVAAIVFAAAGGWIYYNTNIVNEYQTTGSILDKRADFERRYAVYKKLPVVSPVDVAMEVDLYPRERRMVSRGRMTLRNLQRTALDKVVVSADPRLAIDSLELEGGTRTFQDKAQGLYLFNLSRPLQPGSEAQLKWMGTRHNRGFSNSGADTDIVENGTFVNALTVMPLPVYDGERELTDTRERRRRGLSPAPGLAALGDPAAVYLHGFGVENAVNYQVVFSTDADQIAVATGQLRREWKQGGRRYFEYRMESPTDLRISLSSAHYQVARDNWNGVAIEVYHDAKHAWNVPTMLQTSKIALAYYSREFAPYMYSYFRIVEYPGYEDHAQGFPGTVPYTETVGFLTDLSSEMPLDNTTAHELAHMWWGGLAHGARMQGRQILNEGMAEYSRLMLLKQQQNPLWLRTELATRSNSYLHGRKRVSVPEVPVTRAADEQAHLTYGKSAHVMFALEELLGADKVNDALRHFLDKFAMKPPPFPTSLDLLKEVRAEAGPEYQGLITDLFERIMLYDLQMTAVEVTPVDGQFDVTMNITAHQFEADGIGRETEVPLNTWFQVVIFPESKQELLAQTPLYQAFHRLHAGAQRITVRVPRTPGAAGVDPFHLMYDKTPKDNVRVLTY